MKETSQLELGKKSEYPSHYNPNKLFAVARQVNRNSIGVVAGKIQLIQELLGDAVLTIAQLETKTPAELESTLAELQARLRNRQA